MFTDIINQLIQNYNFTLIISINITSYLIIQLLNKTIFVKKGIKIGVTILVSIGMGVAYHFLTDISNEVLINSAIFAPLAWDWIIKPLLKYLNIDYEHYED